jgi:hypothetical protein
MLEEVFGEPFEGGQYFLLRHEGHLAVDLRELRLAVGPQILIAEALHDLEVAVVARYHQNLLEGLGALRQGVRFPGIHAAGHDEVARTFRRTLDEEGRFDLDESFGCRGTYAFPGPAWSGR